MTEDEKQARMAQLRQIPKPVQMAVLLAFALGLVTLARVLAGAYAAQLSVGKGLFHGVLLLFWFLFCGGSLYNRSRAGYVGLIAFSLLPLLGIFALSVHLLRLALEGDLTASWPATIHCIVAVLQLFTTAILFRYLFTKRARDFIWKPAA